jgi:hypothetical protein
MQLRAGKLAYGNREFLGSKSNIIAYFYPMAR